VSSPTSARLAVNDWGTGEVGLTDVPVGSPINQEKKTSIKSKIQTKYALYKDRQRMFPHNFIGLELEFTMSPETLSANN